MKTGTHHRFHFTVLAACGLTLGACQSDKHMMTDAATGKTMVCKECYTAVTAAHRDHPATNASGVQTLSTYQCPCCKMEMSVYIKDGTHMVKCAGCASEGVAWDKCMSPSSAAK
ncbi:MAG: hypothetical protein WC718_01960 [Phycisphaerales bacterium]|jgi:hypothetical protein